MRFYFTLRYVMDSWPGQRSKYSKSLSAGWSRYQNLVGWDFPLPSRLVLGNTQPSIQWVPDHSWGVKQPGYIVNHIPSLSTQVKERLQLYLYFPSVLSWQVTDCSFYLYVMDIEYPVSRQSITLKSTLIFPTILCTPDLRYAQFHHPFHK